MSQQSFFDNEPNEQENPFHDWMKTESVVLVQVVFPTGLDGIFDYLVPPELEGQLFPGMRIMVPLGRANRSILGYCVGETFKTLDAKQRSRLKAVQNLVDSQRLLSDKMLRLADWISEYYLCPLGTVLEAMLPAGVRGQAATRLTSVFYVAEDVDKKLEQLKNLAKPGSSIKSFDSTTKNRTLISDKQLYVLDVLRRCVEPLSSTELMKAAKCSQAPVLALKRLGLIKTKTIRRETSPKNETVTEINPADKLGHTLNPQQQAAFDTIIDAVEKLQHETFLLHGVTGSGKTEVYIRAIAEVVKSGRQAIVLVPEISLTPQTVGRFKGRFNEVAVLHSHLTDAERNRQWNRIIRGEVEVVVGARSAVFAPVPDLGLIIIDEEHESSFKQDSSPRYHTRDVARMRAKTESVPLVLGSATPSMESWHSARIGEFKLITMSNRVRNRSLPSVKIVDLREAVRSRTTRGAIHRQLHSAIDQAIKNDEQVILLLNRRGYSTHIQCPACGDIVKCPNCDVSLTHHKIEEIALCHYCDYQIPSPVKCPSCGFMGIYFSGFATQKLEEEIKTRFPNVPVLRMDTDTMQGHGAHERALSQFREGKIKILLGTQMIAKGLDFPNVTLVGVINADTAMYLPDFRASERTFLLITQVAGRTGRGEKEGRVIVQTFNPDHPAIQSASQHDYRNFVNQELPLRETLGYPPFTKIGRIVVRGPDESKALQFAKEIGERLRKELEQGNQYSETTKPPYFRLLGPAPAPLAKLRNVYRFHLLIHVADGNFLRWAFRRATSGLKTPSEIQWFIDIDPMDML